MTWALGITEHNLDNVSVLSMFLPCFRSLSSSLPFSDWLSKQRRKMRRKRPALQDEEDAEEKEENAEREEDALLKPDAVHDEDSERKSERDSDTLLRRKMRIIDFGVQTACSNAF